MDSLGLELPLTDAPSAEQPCFVCAYADSTCARAELVGRLRGLAGSIQGATLRLESADGSEAELELRPPWHRLVGDLERHGLARGLGPTERPVTLAAYHLQLDSSASDRWVAGPEALVVLEPEWLEDVTSLTRTQFCERVYLIGKFRSDTTNEAILRGNIAHATFQQILASPRENARLQRALEQALGASVITLAALGVEPDEARDATLPALRKLVRWARSRAPTGEVRTETFLLAHRLGMRGRIDAAWEREGRIETVAELKTGTDWNGMARVEHQLQVGAYGLMLAERGQAQLRQERLLLLYAGNGEVAGRLDLERQVPFRAQTFANLVHFRNRLVLIDLTGRATYQKPGRCRRCELKHDCHRLTELLEAPRCVSGCVLGDDCRGQRTFDETERTFFGYWASLLDEEWRALNDATARLWRTDPATRCADGVAAAVLEFRPADPERICLAGGEDDEGVVDRPEYHLRIANDCEIRQGDRVLLSEASGPSRTRIAQVEVLEATEGELRVRASEPLSFSPSWVDQYASDRLFLRAYAGLYQWLGESPERRALITRERCPRFLSGPAPLCTDLPGGRELNEQQHAALDLALRARDYLIVQGPPGSGKTELIATLARQLTQPSASDSASSGRGSGQASRVLLVANTNRAIDRLLEACSQLGLEDRCVRLGGRPEPRSAGERRLLARLVWDRIPEQNSGETGGATGQAFAGNASLGLAAAVRRARQLLFGSPILAATISTLSNADYAALRGQFDVVVVDEASQITLPAVLGALTFGQRFVLVGDQSQLPPVVQSARPGSAGLSESLFEHLARKQAAKGGPGLVRLEEQYRMNAEICGFPSRAWYDGKLRPAPSIAHARLTLRPAAGLASSDGLSMADAVLDPDRPIIFVDVPGSTTNPPRSNRREAVLARLLLEAARRRGLDPRDLAVIAPFRAQVASIRSQLVRADDAELRRQAHDLVDTVDRFQGSERSCVIYSFSSFAPELHPLMQDQRRLNVALTRAKHKLILLGDLAVLRPERRFAELEAYCRQLYPDGGGVIEWQG